MSAQILMVEDDAAYSRIAALALEGEGLRVDSARDLDSAKHKLGAGPYDLVITDLKLPGGSGVDLLEWINATLDPPPPVLMMTAFATVQTAVRAMKLGAADYLAKPFSNDELILAVKKALHVKHLEQENLTLRQALESGARFENIIGTSLAVQEMFDLMRKAAPRDVNVLIRGQSGAGKELVARALHYASPRRLGPFVAVDSAAIPENLLESELFGYVKGAFTGALRDSKGKLRGANGGTLFFDEIGDMSPRLQVKLLRVLQERVFTPIGSIEPVSVDVRVIAATHVDLETAIKEGGFREDLYFRLNVISIRVPPLRERKEDIPILVKHFISKTPGWSPDRSPDRSPDFSRDKSRLKPGLHSPDSTPGGTPVPRRSNDWSPDFSRDNSRLKPGLHKTPGAGNLKVSDQALKVLMDYDWPGNVRELQNAVEHATVLADGDEILPRHLPEGIQQGPQRRLEHLFYLPSQGVDLENLERDLILQALERTSGNQTRAAALLGMSRPTFIYRMEKHGIKEK